MKHTHNKIGFSSILFIRLFLIIAFLFCYTVNNTFAQGTTCADATPFCTAVGVPFTYVNSTTGSLGSMGCLQTTPGPNWFYIKTTTAGTYVFHIQQSTTPGGSANIDVDFIAYGPYTVPTCTFANGGGGLTNDCTSIGGPWGSVEDCSYCWDPTETMTLHPTTDCQIFMVLVTNYSRTAGYITFTQTSGPATDCSISAPPAWTPQTFCITSPAVTLNNLLDAGSGTTGTWSGTGVVGGVFDPATNGPGVYSITYTLPGTCTTFETHDITVMSTSSVPNFTALGPYCINETPGVLHDTSSEGIIGTWNPPLISTSTLGTTVYTFTPLPGQCGTSTTMSVAITSNLSPTFTNLGPYCVGDTPDALPFTSIEGINGSWNPTDISTASVGTTIYTFTPTGSNCATNSTMSVTINNQGTPDFASIPPLCSGAVTPVLSLSAPNGITGTWDPPVIDNTNSGSYTFTPNGGQCAGNQILYVTVNASMTPDFSQIPTFCSGTVAPLLVNTSPNGITGSWNPATINNTSSGQYIFTPDTGQCVNSQTLIVTVLPKTVPDFAAIPEFCSGTTAPILANISPNGITGSWFPAVIDNNTGGTYTFTPDAGQCATTFTLPVTVNLSNNTLLTVPNIFTPNADNINDVFGITGINNFPNSTLVVYNRWGYKVYESNNYDCNQDADGTISGNNCWNGSKLSDGVYFYVLTVNYEMYKDCIADKVNYHGSITILR